MRTHAKALFALALFLCCSLLLSTAFGRARQTLSTAKTATEPEPSAPVIVIDAGHGGEDAGAVGVNGALEKELNLSLCRTLADLFRLAGYTVVETRTEDRLLCDPDTPKGHRKQTDLQSRLAVTESYPDCVLISVHMNTFPNDTCAGTQVWYSQNTPLSLALAESVQHKAKDLLQPQNNRKVKAATSSIYLLRHAKVPAILVECGFLSTPTECERLCDGSYRNMLALVIFEAVSEKLPSPTCQS